MSIELYLTIVGGLKLTLVVPYFFHFVKIYFALMFIYLCNIHLLLQDFNNVLFLCI